jgi:hypothetical protein
MLGMRCESGQKLGGQIKNTLDTTRLRTYEIFIKPSGLLSGPFAIVPDVGICTRGSHRFSCDLLLRITILPLCPAAMDARHKTHG